MKSANLTTDRPIAGIDDAIAETLHLTAVAKVVDDRIKALKAYTGRALGRPGASRKIDGIGTALVTDPTLRPEVVDDDAFRAWALEAHPDRTEVVRRVDPAAIATALDDPDVGPRLAAILDEVEGAVTADVVISAKLVDEVAKPTQVREMDDGTLVDRQTGEIIPGVRLKLASTPSPRITPDKDAVAALVAEIAGRLTVVPELEEPSDA